MILVDFSQIMIGTLMSSAKNMDDVSEKLLRHMTLNTIRAHRKKFHRTYGEIVLCIDGKNYWRKDVFPYYKAGRKGARDKSAFDWNEIFGHFDTIKAELKENFPYKMVEVHSAEADDVIATICKTKDPSEKCLILSSDKDFVQLHKYKNVKQYSPMQRKFVTHADPKAYLREHIIRGDKGDGIPNFLSDDADLVNGIRQASIQKKKLDVWLTQTPSEICTDVEMERRYARNVQLVDLDLIPEELTKNILDEYTKEPKGARRKLYNYMIMNQLNNLVGVIGDF